MSWEGTGIYMTYGSPDRREAHEPLKNLNFVADGVHYDASYPPGFLLWLLIGLFQKAITIHILDMK